MQLIHKTEFYKTGLAALALIGLAGSASAQALTPITVTGYNQDVIADGPDSTTQGVINSTTATIDDQFDYLAQGFDPNNPSAGLPAGGTYVSPANSLYDSVTFAIQPATQKNVLLLDGNGGGSAGVSTGTFTLAHPAAYTDLAFDLTGLNGNIPFDFTLNFADGSETITGNTAYDNFAGGTAVAYAVGERVYASPGNGSSLQGFSSGGAPYLYEQDVLLSDADSGRLLDSITFTDTSTGGNTNANVAIFGVSGALSRATPSGLAAAVPESGSLALVSLGLLPAALLARKRRIAK